MRFSPNLFKLQPKFLKSTFQYTPLSDLLQQD